MRFFDFFWSKEGRLGRGDGEGEGDMYVCMCVCGLFCNKFCLFVVLDSGFIGLIDWKGNDVFYNLHPFFAFRFPFSFPPYPPLFSCLTSCISRHRTTYLSLERTPSFYTSAISLSRRIVDRVAAAAGVLE